MTANATDPDYEGYPSRKAPDIAEVERRHVVFRHPVIIRITHWINAICLSILLMSGLQIFNAHPSLYWGKVSTFDSPLLTMKATEDEPQRGITSIAGKDFDTTGVLGFSSFEGEDTERGFPAWMTLPAGQDLATARRWHFLFAWFFVINGLIYLAYTIATGQFRFRVIPTREELRNIGHSIVQHAMLRFPKGEEAKRYNVLQKLTYLVVIVILIPVQILAGLTMSPAMNARFPFLLDLFSGRQSARTIHFVIASLLVAFVIVHVVMVVLAGPFNNLRGMITGWFVVDSRTRELPAKAKETEA